MDYRLVEAERRHVGALVRLSAALFREDAGTRDPLTDVGWPEEHGWDHLSGLVARDEAVCLMAFSGRQPAAYLAGLIRRPPYTEATEPPSTR